MDTLKRGASRTAPADKSERVGYGLVAVGYAVMTLGILEIGGLFNVVLGLVVAWGGCILMFGSEVRRRSGEDAEFERLVDEL